MYDFAVDHDNSLYDLTQTAFDNHATTTSTDCTLSLISPLDPLPDYLASSNPFFDFTEFESFGSSLYTQFNADPHAWTAAEIPALNLPAPSPLSFNAHEEVEAAPNKDTAPHTSPMRLAAAPLPQVATAPSPTPSLSFSAPSTFSSPSPASIVDDDFTMLDDDPDYGSPVPPRSGRANKQSSNASARKVRVYAGPAASFPARSAGRFPCSVPGCKQVCRTLGDLKRHESILAHKPPSWECPRCHYNFTREDALKRHTKNVSNCASVNVKARVRGASVKPQNLDTYVSAEVS
jgi:hypothetical protein